MSFKFLVYTPFESCAAQNVNSTIPLMSLVLKQVFHVSIICYKKKIIFNKLLSDWNEKVLRKYISEKKKGSRKMKRK